MDGIDEAASAFESAISGQPVAKPVSNAPRGKPTERMFADVGEFIPGSENEVAGGDEQDEKRQRRVKPETKVEEDEPELFKDDDGNLFTLDADGNPVPYDEPEEDEAKKKDDEDDDEDDDEEVTVTIDGEQKTVKLSEALNGYVRQETFHQRLNHLNTASQAVETEARKVVASRDKYVNLLREAEEQLKLIVPAEPDWDKLYSEDPNKARALQKQYDAFKAKGEELKATREAAEKERAAQDAEETARFAKKEFARFSTIARWSNREDMAKDISSMRRTALSVGITEPELAETYDSRMLTVLLKASKYDRMMAARPKVVKRGKSITPGAGHTRTAPKGNGRAMEKLRRSGSIDDAASVFAQILK